MTPIKRASTDRHQPQRQNLRNDVTTDDQRPLYWPLTWRGTEHHDSHEHHAPKPSNKRQHGFIEPHLIGLLTLTAPAAGALAAIVTGVLR